jgi:hypothetical protein
MAHNFNLILPPRLPLPPLSSHDPSPLFRALDLSLPLSLKLARALISQCPIGAYNEETGANSSTRCIPCIAGKYSEQIAANSSDFCLPCVAGTYNDKIGANTSLLCLPCLSGKYSSKAAANSTADCLDCPAGAC